MNIKGRIRGEAIISMLLALACVFSLGASDLRSGGEANLICTDLAGGDAAAVSYITDYEAEQAIRIEAATPDVGADGSISLGSRFWELISGGEIPASCDGTRPTLIVGGCVFGTRIKEARISVGSAEEGSPFKEGDKIISINGKDIRTVSDIKGILKNSDGSPLSVLCKRGGHTVTLKCTPKASGGEYRLGVTLREGAAGIGTVTYVNPATGEFGGLGHGICDPDDGKIIEMAGGTVTDVILGGVVKGESGKPGELSGILTDRPMGEIYANTDCGVFGKLTSLPRGTETKLLPIAYRSEVKSGKATILSTLKNGKTMEYNVELCDVKPGTVGTKCFRIRVTDPALLSITGGIVRGMSGSPIIQDGKLVGAVTHVMINDPTMGYGIFIENMLNASQMTRNELPKAA